MKFNADAIKDVRFWIGTTLLVTAIFIGILFTNGCSKPAPKPSPENPFKAPIVDGMYQGDTEELLAAWTKAQVQVNLSQNLINDYVKLMQAKVKKNGLKEGTTIEFIAQKPCIPSDNGSMMCAQGVNVVQPPPPPAKDAPKPGKK